MNLKVVLEKFEEGRFLSIDPLWEKYLAWSPYHYCGNNPVNATDGNGMYPNYENLNDQEVSIIKQYNSILSLDPSFNAIINQINYAPYPITFLSGNLSGFDGGVWNPAENIKGGILEIEVILDFSKLSICLVGEEYKHINQWQSNENRLKEYSDEHKKEMNKPYNKREHEIDAKSFTLEKVKNIIGIVNEIESLKWIQGIEKSILNEITNSWNNYKSRNK